jgi:hypothetical protein
MLSSERVENMFQSLMSVLWERERKLKNNKFNENNNNIKKNLKLDDNFSETDTDVVSSDLSFSSESDKNISEENLFPASFSSLSSKNKNKKKLKEKSNLFEKLPLENISKSKTINSSYIQKDNNQNKNDSLYINSNITSRSSRFTPSSVPQPLFSTLSPPHSSSSSSSSAFNPLSSFSRPSISPRRQVFPAYPCSSSLSSSPYPTPNYHHLYKQAKNDISLHSDEKNTILSDYDKEILLKKKERKELERKRKEKKLLLKFQELMKKNFNALSSLKKKNSHI